LHVDLQDGKFDNASRLFWSIQNSFTQAWSITNDYRELIPEFFSSPEFLLNRDHFDLGSALGTKVDDVVLPPWASSVHEFIYLNRKALESEFVSSHIQHWIDLIWGDKQKGEKAILAHNTFMPEMYDNIWGRQQIDPLARARIEAVTSHCGQIPPQLFLAPHPERAGRAAKHTVLSMPLTINFGLRSTLCGLVKSDGRWTICVSLVDSSGGCVTAAFAPEALSKLIRVRRQVSELTSENILSNLPIASFPPIGQRRLCAVMNDTQFIVVGEDRTELNKVDVHKGTVQVLSPQRAEIVAIAVDGTWIATANRGSELLIYNVTVDNAPILTIPAFVSSVACCALSNGFHSVVYGTRDGSLLFCSLNSGSVTRFISVAGSRPCSILITPFWGFVVVYLTRIVDGKLQHSISLYSTNGDLIRTIVHSHAIVQWVSFTSSDGFDFVVMADAANRCFLFEAFYLNVSKELFIAPATVTSLNFLPSESTAVIATANGELILVHSEPNGPSLSEREV
jgi:hypothetical protein